jgi:hypothetical protein
MALGHRRRGFSQHSAGRDGRQPKKQNTAQGKKLGRKDADAVWHAEPLRFDSDPGR